MRPSKKGQRGVQHKYLESEREHCLPFAALIDVKVQQVQQGQQGLSYARMHITEGY